MKSRPGRPFLRVLVDVADAQLRGFVHEALARAGYAAESCTSSSSVVDRYNTECHSFLVTDSRSASASGFARILELRRRSAALPVILLSAGPCQDLEALCEGQGDVVCLQRPFTQRTLEGAIERVCVGWRRPPTDSGSDLEKAPEEADARARSK